MARIEVTLPHVSKWGAKVFDEAGVPRDVKYSEIRFYTGKKLLASGTGYADTLAGRLGCIKSRSGGDASIHAKLAGYNTVTLIAEIDQPA